MVKGTKTSLTYRVMPYYYFSSWLMAQVYEPYMKPKRLFGLIPARLAYRHVFNSGEAGQVRLKVCGHATPDEIRRAVEKAVELYEAYKIAWEYTP